METIIIKNWSNLQATLDETQFLKNSDQRPKFKYFQFHKLKKLVTKCIKKKKYFCECFWGEMYFSKIVIENKLFLLSNEVVKPSQFLLHLVNYWIMFIMSDFIKKFWELFLKSLIIRINSKLTKIVEIHSSRFSISLLTSLID